MADLLLGLTLVCAAGAVILLVVLLRRRVTVDFAPLAGRMDGFDRAQEKVERSLREELARNREEAQAAARQLREEVSGAVKDLREAVTTQLIGLSGIQHQRLDEFSGKLTALTTAVDTRMTQFAEGDQQRSDAMRTMTEERLKLGQQENSAKLELIRTSTDQRLSQFQTVITASLETVRGVVDQRLKGLQEENAKKLDEMRATVDEKLQGTLEKRLGDSFKIVSERLEQVHKGLGEMQSLASGVGDLKRVLSNVKTRGTWGEIQLESLLEQFLSIEQFAKNVAIQESSNERVEFAIRFPGRDGNEVLLPIDAKFPVEDYQRLVEAHERCDLEAIEVAGRALEQRVKACAREICDKYIHPPRTTNFGILYLPIEGLYAEVTRRLGLAETLRRDCHVEIAGPSTLPAMLSSFQMGFRTLVIEQRSNEVWELLGTVKTEFGKYGGVLAKVQKKLQEASNTIDQAQTRTRVITRKLKNVQELSAENGEPLLLELTGGEVEIEADVEAEDESSAVSS